MELKVLRGGMLTTVQDLGRRGHRAAGVPLGGAMDSFALRIANLLVGNPEGHAAIEFTMSGPEIEFSDDAMVAVTGAECEGVPGWRPLVFRAGERLRLAHCSRGCRGYVAVRGGIAVPPVLGSRSTFLRGAWGGFEGRTLREGDRVKVGECASVRRLDDALLHGWQIDRRVLPAYSSAAVVRAIRGTSPSGWNDELFTTEFKVSHRSDRMGLRLAAQHPPQVNGPDLLSAAVVPGTIQAPPDGQPVVLMADAPTIGGYAQVANVISVDLPLVAQLRPGDTLRLVDVSVVEAQRLALQRERVVSLLREGLAEKVDGSGGREHS